MAYLVSIANGNLTSSSSWALVDTTSLNDSRVANTTLSTTPVASTAFTPGAITVQGVAIQIGGRGAVPTGTMTVELYNSTGAVSVRTVTINVSDLPNTTAVSTLGVGWVYFKFSSSVTLLAATSYTIRLSTSNVSQVAVNSLATTNWSRALVTTTNQAPATTDSFIIAGALTAAATSTPVTITMDNTAAVSYANTYVGHLGTLTYATASSTNYNLTLAGNLIVSQAGSLIIGASASPIPSTSTATLQLTCTTALQFTMLVYGTMTTYGATKSIATKLAADVIATSTTSTTSTSTGWLNGDIIVVPSTTRTYTQYESKTLSANAVGTTLTHNAYTNAHGGNATTRAQADIVNLTRNIIIRSTTGTLLTNKTNLQLFPRSVTSFYYTAFQALGTGITIANSGICVNALTAGTFDFQYNVIREIATQAALNTAATALQTDNTTTGITISNNIFYNLGWTATVVSSIIASINDNNYFMGCLSTTQTLLANYAGSGNVFASNNTPAAINAFYANSSNCSFYSNNTIGLNMPAISNLTTVNTNLSNFRFWANNQYGMQIVNVVNTSTRINILSFTGSYIFGNTTMSINIPSRLSMKIYFSNSYFYGGTALTGQQPTHFLSSSTIIVDSMYYDNCYFGYSDSALTSNAFGGANLLLPISSSYQLFSNCYFNTANTEMNVTSGYPYTNLYGGYRSLNHNGVTGSNKDWMSNGTITTDTTIYLSSTKSTRLTPNVPLVKLISPIVRVPVKSGDTCTISVRLRRSVVGDGAAYNGTAPRLMYGFNPVLGNLTETIGYTSVGVAGSWETLTYTTATFSSDGVAEFYVDCDGTAGWINIDDWNTTTTNDSRGQDYWGVNGVYIEPTYRRTGGSSTFTT